MTEERGNFVKTIVDTLPTLLQPDVIRLLLQLTEFLAQRFSKPAVIGMYEVMEHSCQLELCTADGQDAIYTKRQRVTFLQDNIIAYQDDNWGDGDIFAEYQCSPGIAVDRYKEGQHHHVLISLRKTMNRGDVQGFHIRRRIRNGFTKATDDFQVEVNHRTHKLTMQVVFPPERWPKQCWLVEQNTRRTQALSAEHFSNLSDKRLQVTWGTDKPKLFEMYILRWEW